MFFADEVRSPADLTSGLSDLAISDREVKTARQLISAMAAEWIPEKHADVYREELLDLLRSKPATSPTEQTSTSVESPIGDLMSALRASVEAARRRGAKKTAGSKRAG
jgi:DNA end-binding protein Ku